MLTAASGVTKCVPFSRGDRGGGRHVLINRRRRSVTCCESWRDVLNDGYGVVPTTAARAMYPTLVLVLRIALV